MDWGFKLTNLYGIDYRYTTAKGWFSDQLLKHNNLYGYDPLQCYFDIYFPRRLPGPAHRLQDHLLRAHPWCFPLLLRLARLPSRNPVRLHLGRQGHRRRYEARNVHVLGRLDHPVLTDNALG